MVADEKTVALKGFEPQLSQLERQVKRWLAEALDAGGFSPPDAAASGARGSGVADLLALLRDEGRAVEIDPKFFPASGVAAESRRLVADRLAGGSTTTMAGLRDLLDTSLRYAVPIGEHLDRACLTVREGDVRRLGLAETVPVARSWEERPNVCDPRIRSLPPVHAILERPELVALRSRLGHAATVDVVRAAIDEARKGLLGGEADPIGDRDLALRAASILASDRPARRRVINATGILLHAGLGRAPLAAEAVEAITAVARDCCNLEFDLETGGRGARATGVSGLLRRPAGAEAAAVANNNAG